MQLRDIPTSGYERVVHASDPSSGLEALVSIHSTVLGPSLGGIRMLAYASLDEALLDVNRLSKGMTYKAAIAETGQGGGKAVIIGDPRRDKSDALFRAMGKFIDLLDGAYIAAEDMNITVDNLETIAQETSWVSGLAVEHGSSGNPSPVTAWGCFLATQACLDEVFGDPSLNGRVIAVQGVGAVGSVYARYCKEAGARVNVADTDPARARVVAAAEGCSLVEDPEEILTVECDLLAPCARGAIVNETSIPKLRCKVVAGAANNQLEETEDARRLADRGVLYAPDYVVNAGGIINIAVEYAPEGYSMDAALERCHSIPRALRTIFEIARNDGITTADAADQLAEARLAAARK